MHTALAKDSNSVLGTHIRCFITAWDLNVRQPNSLFYTLWVPSTCVYIPHTDTHKIKKKKTRKVWFLFLRFSGPGNITHQMHMKRKLDDEGYIPTSRGLERKHLLRILGNICVKIKPKSVAHNTSHNALSKLE